MTILAILQNQWFKDPSRVKSALNRRDEKFRRRFLKHALFSGCRTGRVLLEVFGDLCDSMIFEEASREIGGTSSSVFGYDLGHLQAVCSDVKPDIIIAFGKVASSGVMELGFNPVIAAPHPTARGADTIQKLKIARRHLETYLNHGIQ